MVLIPLPLRVDDLYLYSTSWLINKKVNAILVDRRCERKHAAAARHPQQEIQFRDMGGAGRVMAPQHERWLDRWFQPPGDLDFATARRLALLYPTSFTLAVSAALATVATARPVS